MMLATTSLFPLPEDETTRFYVGIAAALASMACWVITSIAFTLAGRRFGSTTVNVTRSIIAMIILLIAVRLLTGAWFAHDDFETTLWLALSGIAGLAIGDQLVFGAFVRVGPRLTLLILNLAPVATALFALPILGEPLANLAWVGMLITLLAVAWVVAEREQGSGEGSASPAVPRRIGVTMAVTGMLVIAIGNVLAKLGMLGPSDEMVSPLVAQNIRMVAGAILIAVLAALARVIGWEIGAPREKDPADRPARGFALGALALGTILGPVLGIWFFLLAASLLKVAIAATVIALTPVAIIPFNSLVERTRVSPRAVLGAVIAVVGVAILAWSEPVGSDEVDESTASPASSIETLDSPS